MNDVGIFVAKNPHDEANQDSAVKENEESENKNENIKKHKRRNGAHGLSGNFATRSHEFLGCAGHIAHLFAGVDMESMLYPLGKIVYRLAYLALQHGPVTGKPGNLRTHKV